MVLGNKISALLTSLKFNVFVYTVAHFGFSLQNYYESTKRKTKQD